jgi:hypothetical protein
VNEVIAVRLESCRPIPDTRPGRCDCQEVRVRASLLCIRYRQFFHHRWKHEADHLPLMKRTICGSFINTVCVFHGEEPRRRSRSRSRLYFCFATLIGSWLLLCVRASDLAGTIGCTWTLPEHESYQNKTYTKFGSYLTANVWCLQCRNQCRLILFGWENNSSYGSLNETQVRCIAEMQSFLLVNWGAYTGTT